MPDQTRSRLDLDWVKTTAGALAAVSSAVLLSTLGAAGTLIGAALGSVAATVTSALYSQGLARSRDKVAAVHQQALQKVGVAQADVRRAVRDPEHTGDLEEAQERWAQARAELDEAEQQEEQQEGSGEARSLGDRLRVLPWKRIGVYAAGTFAAAVLVLSVVEAVLGNPVSSYTGGSEKGGGTSISRLTGSDRNADDARDRDRPDRDGGDREGEAPQDGGATPTDGATPTEGTTGGSDTDGEIDGGTGETTPTPGDGVSQQPTESPTGSPSSTPTGTPELGEPATDQRAPTPTAPTS